VRFPRWVAMALALSLTPVLVLVTAHAAEAASGSIGDTSTASWNDGLSVDFRGTSTVSCTATGYWTTTPASGPGADYGVATIYAKGTCGTGADVSSAFMHLSADCGGTSLTFDTGQVDGDGGEGDFSGTWSGSVVVPSDGTAPCAVTQLCWGDDVKYHINPFNTEHHSGCVEWSLGAPPALTQDQMPSCPLGSVQKPVPDMQGGKYQDVLSGSGWLFDTYHMQYTSAGSNEVYGYQIYRSVSVAHDSSFYSGFANSSWFWGISAGVNGGSPYSSSGMSSHQANLTSGQTVNWDMGEQVTEKGTPPPTDRHWELVGFGYIVPQSGAQLADPFSTGDGSEIANSASLIGRTTGTSQWCSWYWGEQLRTNIGPGDTSADPIGPADASGNTPQPPTVDNPPPVTDDACSGFSFTDPATWAGPAMCMVAHLLQKALDMLSGLLHAIENLASAIFQPIVDALNALVGAILDGLQALFVPESAEMQGDIQGVKDSWSDAAPMTVFTSVGDVVGALNVPSPGGSCAGPDYTFTNPVSHSAQTLHPFDSCSSPMSTIAMISRAALQVGVWVAGVLLAFRVLAAAFGVRVSAGEESSA
jgi:hypothetical protein